MNDKQYAWTVLIREGRWWRVLAHYYEYSEARRSSCATRADGTRVKILPFGDDRIQKLLSNPELTVRRDNG